MMDAPRFYPAKRGVESCSKADRVFRRNETVRYSRNECSDLTCLDGGFFRYAAHAQQLGGYEFPVQPDGGEGLATRKGVVVRRGLKEACTKATT